MNNNFTEKWAEISDRGHASGRFRVCPDHILDLFIGFSVAGEREFTLESKTSKFLADEIPQFENIAVHINEFEGVRSLTLRLTERTLTDLFSVICSDLAEASSGKETADGTIQVFVVRLNRWAELLRRRLSHELSFKERLGLLGELSMLIWVIDTCAVDASLAVRGWRGPEGDTNDLGLNSVRIEIKAQLSTQRRSLKISSIDQLDWNGRNLFVALHRFSASDSGLCLESLISAISAKLKTKFQTTLEFQRKLIVAGYDHEASYITETFNLEGIKIYRISDGFPRLVANNVAKGIIKAQYEIACDAIEEFLIEPSELKELIHA